MGGVDVMLLLQVTDDTCTMWVCIVILVDVINVGVSVEEWQQSVFNDLLAILVRVHGAMDDFYCHLLVMCESPPPATVFMTF